MAKSSALAAPVNPAANDEIVREIAKRLKPWRSDCAQAEILEGVRKAVELLQATVPEFFSREAAIKTRTDGRLLLRDIKAIERRILGNQSSACAWSLSECRPACSKISINCGVSATLQPRLRQTKRITSRNGAPELQSIDP